MYEVMRTVFIDPSYSTYYKSRLFDVSNPVLNRDGTLEPFSRLKSFLNHQDIEVYTADELLDGTRKYAFCDYYSLGLLDNYPKLIGRKNVCLKGFLVLEPPVVAPKLYRALPELTRYFERVYVHNIIGDGYSLRGVDQSKLRTFYWPQPNEDVFESYWSNEERQNRIVVINSNHIPRSFCGQLYSKRIEAMSYLAKLGIVDLYGHGWNKWWSHRSMWPPYWTHYRSLMSIYRGTCDSKYEILSKYTFSLCFENMVMNGYVTEKIFDCFYSGTIPLYLGAKDIESLIPCEAYIDCRKFSSWNQLKDTIDSMSEKEILDMRMAGRDFIRSKEGARYYNSLINIFDGD